MTSALSTTMPVFLLISLMTMSVSDSLSPPTMMCFASVSPWPFSGLLTIRFPFMPLCLVSSNSSDSSLISLWRLLISSSLATNKASCGLERASVWMVMISPCYSTISMTCLSADTIQLVMVTMLLLLSLSSNPLLLRDFSSSKYSKVSLAFRIPILSVTFVAKFFRERGTLENTGIKFCSYLESFQLHLQALGSSYLAFQNCWLSPYLFLVITNVDF